MTPPNMVAVTGANGFVGKALCSYLIAQGIPVRKIIRNQHSVIETQKSDHQDTVEIGNIDGETDWAPIFSDGKVDAVIHLAARVHIMDKSQQQISLFRQVNVEGTQKLFEACNKYGVRRFIFVSSIKAIGEGRATPYTEADQPQPEDAYGISKHEAELTLLKQAEYSSCEVVIVRPPLMYGPHVTANFLRLLRLVDLGLPLPFGSSNNRRSLLYIDNMVDFLTLCLHHPNAANETFFVTDDHDLSTSDLVKHIANSMNKSIILFPIPKIALRIITQAINKREIFNRLWGDLSIDIGKAKETLGWHPPYSVEQGMQNTVQWFYDSQDHL